MFRLRSLNKAILSTDCLLTDSPLESSRRGSTPGEDESKSSPGDAPTTLLLTRRQRADQQSAGYVSQGQRPGMKLLQNVRAHPGAHAGSMSPPKGLE